MDIMQEIESEIFRNQEWCDRLNDKVDEDDMNAEDAGVLMGAECA